MIPSSPLLNYNLGVTPIKLGGFIAKVSGKGKSEKNLIGFTNQFDI